ncbi:MAG: hypothetical protein ACLTSZ_04545 [Lachnospiraceae bacterium]
MYNNYPADAVSVGAVEATRGEMLACNEVLYYSDVLWYKWDGENLSKEQAFREFLATGAGEAIWNMVQAMWYAGSARITKEELLLQAQKTGAFSGNVLDTVAVRDTRKVADGQVR